MTESNVQTFNRVIAAFNEGGFDAALEYFADDAELVDPDLSPVPLRGQAEIREAIGRMLSAWEVMRVRDFELIPVGERVVGLVHTYGQGTGTRGKMEVEFRDGHVMTFRDGKIIEWRMYVDQDVALAEAGLEPRSRPGTEDAGPPG